MKRKALPLYPCERSVPIHAVEDEFPSNGKCGFPVG
jgi:hypothetical protein